MASYKGHSLFALILSLLFFQNPLLIALTVIGANIPDFDHDFKKDNVYEIIILGLIIFIILYILKQPPYIGLIIVFLGVTFYFSKHRSFTHSIFGVLTLTSATSLIIIGGLELINTLTPLNNNYLAISILIILLSFIFVNRKILIIFIPLLLISLIILPQTGISYLKIVFGLFLGLLSHVVLDSFTPSGIKLFAPLSSKKVYKKFGIVMIIILLITSLVYNFDLILNLIKYLK